MFTAPARAAQIVLATACANSSVILLTACHVPQRHHATSRLATCRSLTLRPSIWRGAIPMPTP
jgi:hypothetical protein